MEETLNLLESLRESVEKDFEEAFFPFTIREHIDVFFSGHDESFKEKKSQSRLWT